MANVRSGMQGYLESIENEAWIESLGGSSAASAGMGIRHCERVFHPVQDRPILIPRSRFRRRLLRGQH
jgi:hypothetical protein